MHKQNKFFLALAYSAVLAVLILMLALWMNQSRERVHVINEQTKSEQSRQRFASQKVPLQLQQTAQLRLRPSSKDSTSLKKHEQLTKHSRQEQQFQIVRYVEGKMCAGGEACTSRYGLSFDIAAFQDETTQAQLVVEQRNAIPRILWTYWEETQTPLIAACIARAQEKHPHWDLHVLNTDTFLQIVHTSISDLLFQKLTPASRSDFVRLHVLSEHGGVWFDASTVFNESLDAFIERCEACSADMAGVYTPSNARHATVPPIESFFIVAPPASPILCAWRDEFTHVHELGVQQYKSRVRKLGVDLQGHGANAYFAVYWALQTVLQLGQRLQGHETPFTCYIETSADSFFALQDDASKLAKITQLNYSDLLAQHFASPRASRVPYVKLTKSDRQLFPNSFFSI